TPMNRQATERVTSNPVVTITMSCRLLKNLASRARGDARYQNASSKSVRCRHAHKQARCRHNPVIGTEHRGAQPADPRSGVPFHVQMQTAHRAPFIMRLERG